jgi:3-hydroxyacyl-[acyl-carrier-protein] dehydratase
MAVLYLLKCKRPELTSPVSPARIFFTSCDGVRCQRMCRPADVLTLVVKPKRIKHPLAIFQGHITCGNERVAFAEEITLTFDYAQPGELTNGNGHSAEAPVETGAAVEPAVTRPVTTTPPLPGGRLS